MNFAPFPDPHGIDEALTQRRLPTAVRQLTAEFFDPTPQIQIGQKIRLFIQKHFMSRIRCLGFFHRPLTHILHG